MSNGTATARRNRSKVARAMDIRTVIGVLLGLYGIILTITGLVKGSDAHADLVSGMCLLVAGAVFLGEAPPGQGAGSSRGGQRVGCRKGLSRRDVARSDISHTRQTTAVAFQSISGTPLPG